MGTTLTGTGLDRASPLYFQMVPDNTRQATLVSEYAESLDVSTVTLVHPPLGNGDIYVETLVTETEKRVARTRKADRLQWQRNPDELGSFCAEGRSPEDELVYYIGREDHFEDFLKSATEGCAGRVPRIVAADSVSRFIAQPDRRNNSGLAGLPVSYVGMGPLVTLAGQKCVEGKASSPLSAFCAEYDYLRKRHVEDGVKVPEVPWPAERSGITYDTAGTFVADKVTAPRLNGGGGGQQLHRGALAQLLREREVHGATGVIDFSRSRIGNERPIAVLKFDDIRATDSVPVCEFMIGKQRHKNQDHDPKTGCPDGPRR